MMTPSSILLPWREEEVEEGKFPLTSIFSLGGERKIKVQGCLKASLLGMSGALHLGIFDQPESYPRQYRPQAVGFFCFLF